MVLEEPSVRRASASVPLVVIEKFTRTARWSPALRRILYTRGSERGSPAAPRPRRRDSRLHSGLRILKEQLDGAQGRIAIHILRLRAEAAFLRVAVGTRQIALLRDRQRQRPHRPSHAELRPSRRRGLQRRSRSSCSSGRVPTAAVDCGRIVDRIDAASVDHQDVKCPWVPSRRRGLAGAVPASPETSSDLDQL